MYPYLINSCLTFLSLATATGVFLHDTRVDKAAVISSLPVASTTPESGSKLIQINTNDFHTHVERGSVVRAFSTVNSSAPSIAPRAEAKKHLLQQYAGKGHHAFDNYNLPIL